MLAYVGYIIGGVSLIGAVGIPLYLLRGNKALTQNQLDAYDDARKEAENEKERKRKEDDDDRERKRKEADEAREARLQKQVEDLGELNQRRFRQWQEATEDLDDLWGFFEDEIMPWMREAYPILRESNPDFRRPPQLRRRHREQQPGWSS